jgi:hypothetical protein
MNRYILGNSVTLSAAFVNGSTPTDPTTITFKIRRELTGTITTYVYGTDAELEKDSTGNYHVDYNPPAVGDYYYGFWGTGACLAADEGEFEVRRSHFS